MYPIPPAPKSRDIARTCFLSPQRVQIINNAQNDAKTKGTRNCSPRDCRYRTGFGVFRIRICYVKNFRKMLPDPLISIGLG